MWREDAKGSNFFYGIYCSGGWREAANVISYRSMNVDTFGNEYAAIVSNFNVGLSKILITILPIAGTYWKETSMTHTSRRVEFPIIDLINRSASIESQFSSLQVSHYS